MLKVKNCKMLLVCACIISLILPYATPTLAATTATYKQSDLTGATMKFFSIQSFSHERNSYKLKDSAEGSLGHVVYDLGIKKDEESSYDQTNEIYCLDGEKFFPVTMAGGSVSLSLYKNVGNFFDVSNEEVSKYVNDSSSTNRADNYKAICWLLNNFYLINKDDSSKSKYNIWIERIFADYFTKNSVDTIADFKSLIDFDDIEALQQCAIWYFSNPGFLSVNENASVDASVYTSGYDYSRVGNLNNVVIKYEIANILSITKSGNINPENLSTEKATILNMIYSYLITNAKAEIENESGNIIYPEFQNTTAVVDIKDNNYKIGPFKISSTNANSSSYRIKLTDGTNDLTNYILKKNDGTKINTLNDVVGKTFYVYVPITEEISNVRIGIEYLDSIKSASFWEKVDDDEKINYTYQPLVWINEENKESQVKEVPIPESDLALRKYIVSVNGDDSVARKPKVDATGLLTGSKTAEYKHKKVPVEVYSNDKIVYEIRVYNEGNTKGYVTEITDFIPSGLELVPTSESTINSNYGWEEENGVAVLTFNEAQILDSINADSINSNKNTITGGLSSLAVQIELRVKDGLTADKVLTNVAEITGDNIKDRDSDKGSIKKPNINEETFSGNPGNKTDLNDNNYHYKGLQDDDDFDKVIIKEKDKPKTPKVDLALKKFVTKINNEKQKDREPKVDVSSLENSTEATYTTNKKPLVVKQGDIVIYTIRVYNEGDTDAYAEEVADYIPEGLGFIVNHKTNFENAWNFTEAIKAGAGTVKLASINNALDNVKLEDFKNETSLEDIEVVKGLAKIKTNILSSELGDSNLIKHFDSKTDKNLDYRDIEVVCVVLVEEDVNKNLRNIAEITDDSTIDDDGKVIKTEDRDSVPDSVNPSKYPTTEKHPSGKSDVDDNDYEELTMEICKYDLALQKFITAVNGDKPENDRTPILTTENGNIRYNHSTEALPLGNGDLIEYTIRVYNEGNKPAYAAKVSDDLPNGLKYVSDNEVNKKYDWKFIDKYGEETKDINQAVTVCTDYLSLEKSKERGEDCLIKPFDDTKPISTDSNNPNPDYRDVKIVFQVNELVLEKTKTTEKRTIINTAEITEETDKNGKKVHDEDSTPGNWKHGEDDIDQEKIYVKYFDLELKKDLVKVLVIENGNTIEYNVNSDQLFKVEINKKKLKSTVVKFVYNITVTNTGEIEGYAKEVKDYIPDGLEFVSDDNTGWYKLENNIVATDSLANTLLKPTESASVQITLKWVNGENNLGKKINIAEISKDDNKYKSPDVDSTPDNKVPDEDDIDNAPVILSISTGSNPTYYKLTVAFAVIVISGMVLIKKYVL